MDSHVVRVLYNGNENRWRMNWWIQIMPNVRVLSRQECAWLAQKCSFGEKIARARISQFQVIKILLEVQMFTDIVELKYKELFFSILTV